MTAAELREWMAFDRVEPIGELRADFRAGLVAATVANVHRGRGRQAFTPADFMPFLDRRPGVAEPPGLTSAERVAAVRALLGARKAGG